MTEPHSRTLWLIRHGETEWARTGQHTGLNDIPLTELGREQARQLGAILKGRQFDRVYSSPLVRARETCELAGYGEKATIVPEAHEWNYGAYEGLRSADIRQTRPGWSIWTHGVEGGETIAQVGERAKRVLAEMDSDRSAVLFAHGHFLRILTTQWLGLPPEAGRLFALLPAAISILGYEGETRVIRVWNRQPELPA